MLIKAKFDGGEHEQIQGHLSDQSDLFLLCLINFGLNHSFKVDREMLRYNNGAGYKYISLLLYRFET